MDREHVCTRQERDPESVRWKAADPQANVHRDKLCFWRRVTHAPLPLGICSNGKRGVRAAQREVYPRRASLRRQVPSQIGICKETRA
eukprot:2595293-Lingulodinium_polyedra.AAC.1